MTYYSVGVLCSRDYPGNHFGRMATPQAYIRVRQGIIFGRAIVEPKDLL